MQTADAIYNIGSINTAKFVYEAYSFDKETIYNIEHIENAQFLFKSADYQELEEKITSLNDLVSLSETTPEKQASYIKQLQDAELKKKYFVEDVRNLYVTISSLNISEDNREIALIRQLFNEGKFREANILLKQTDLKKEKDIQLLNFAQLKQELESNAEKYILKARLVLTDLSDPDRINVAIECFEEAIDSSKKINSANTFIRLYDYGLFLKAQSFATKAIAVFNDAIATLQSPDENKVFVKGYSGNIYNFLAELDLQIGDYVFADNYYGQSIMIFRDLTLEYPEIFIHDLISVYNNRGSFRWQVGIYTEAMDDFNKCIYLFDQIPEDMRGPSMTGMVFVKNNMGNVYSSRQENSAAEVLYTEANELLLELDKKYPGTYAEKLALSFNNMAWAQTRQKKYNTAFSNYTTSIARYRALIKQQGSAYYPDIARALCNFGILLHEMHNYEAALKAFAEAKELNRSMAEIEPRAYLPYLATVLEYEGEMLFEMKDFNGALGNFNAALIIRQDQSSKGTADFSRLIDNAQNWINRIKSNTPK